MVSWQITYTNDVSMLPGKKGSWMKKHEVFPGLNNSFDQRMSLLTQIWIVLADVRYDNDNHAPSAKRTTMTIIAMLFISIYELLSSSIQSILFSFIG